ncbi:KGG domain-containing protein [Streptomyces turgidiscabies]|uniref:KGG domain-containing protein n=1 Tax=Streptomyces turgidiscabies TaxID=85558 RepID=UPI0038F6564D
MAGTRSGGKKTAAKNLAKDPDFYKKIGSKGGRNSQRTGFALATPQQRADWGYRGYLARMRNAARRRAAARLEGRHHEEATTS